MGTRRNFSRKGQVSLWQRGVRRSFAVRAVGAMPWAAISRWGKCSPLPMPAGAHGRNNHQNLINTLVIISFDTFHQTISWMVYLSSDGGVLQSFYNYPCSMFFCEMQLLRHYTHYRLPLPLLLNAVKSKRLKVMVKWKIEVTHVGSS